MDENDTEFATKEDLDAINANPELKKVYDAMNAGVTKKFQSYSQSLREREDALKSMEEINRQWEEWRPIIDSYIENPTFAQNNEGDDDENRGNRNGNRGGNKKRNIDSFDESRFVSRDEVGKTAQELRSELGTTRRMFELSLELDDLRREHAVKYPTIKFDTNKVLATAMEKGYTKLEDAYQSIYRDDFIKSEVESKVSERVKEIEASHRSPGETGSGSMPTFMKPPTNVPKSFSDATKSVLDEIKAGTLTKAD